MTVCLLCKVRNEGFSSELTEDHFVTVVIQIQTSLECPHYPDPQQ